METQTTTPQTPADRAGTVGHETKQAAGDVAQTAAQEAKQVTREAKDQVRQLWGQTRRDLTDQAADAADPRGGQPARAGRPARRRWPAPPTRTAWPAASSTTSPAAPATPRPWLDQRDPGSLLEEARSFARQRPGTFLAIAAGVGVLAGRLSRSLVDEARDSDDSPGAPARQPGRSSGTDGGATTAAPAYGTTTGGYGTGSPVPPAAPAEPACPPPPARRHPPPRRRRSRRGGSRGRGARAAPPFPATSSRARTARTQPIAPDGTPSPIDDEGHLTAEGDDSLRGNR